MSTTRILLSQALARIKADQDGFTDESRKHAVQELEKVLSNQKASDRDIVEAALKQREDIRENGKFGPRGPSGSTFLREMDAYIDKEGHAYINTLYEDSDRDAAETLQPSKR